MKLLIPIKHESVRVPEKNFRELGGEPLWARCLRRFTEFELYVDTDSPILLEQIPAEFPAVTVYQRPDELRGHDVSVNLLIGEFVRRYCDGEEIVAQIHVTSPFLEPLSLRLASQHLEDHSEDGVANIRKGSVAGATKHQARFWLQNSLLKCMPINHNPAILAPTQELTPLYEDNSTFYMFHVDDFRAAHENRLGTDPYFVAVPFPENMDIDTESDWALCQALFRSQLGKHIKSQKQYCDGHVED